MKLRQMQATANASPCKPESALTVNPACRLVLSEVHCKRSDGTAETWDAWSRLPGWRPSCNPHKPPLGSPMRSKQRQPMGPSQCPPALWIHLMSQDWRAHLGCKPPQLAGLLQLPRTLLSPGNLLPRQRGTPICRPGSNRSCLTQHHSGHAPHA